MEIPSSVAADNGNTYIPKSVITAGARENPQSESVNKFMAYNWIDSNLIPTSRKTPDSRWRPGKIHNQNRLLLLWWLLLVTTCCCCCCCCCCRRRRHTGKPALPALKFIECHWNLNEIYVVQLKSYIEATSQASTRQLRTPAGGRENSQSKSVKKFMAYHWILNEIYGVRLKSKWNLWRTTEI